tara:strand:- start:24 stop:467 length:444 start_codon:yes stop_codon:yes gene_type:complete
MATAQDYFNMAVSMSVGNKAGTDNFAFLPDDLRKFKDLKVNNVTVQTLSTPGGATVVPLNTYSSTDSFFMAFFSHPVRVTTINGQALGAGNELYTSFVAFGRNYKGTANITNVAVGYVNDLHTPDFASTSGGATEDVDVIYVRVRFE